MKQFYSILLLTLAISTAYCQNILNGDFETNTASNCHWNLTDSAYNSKMSNSWGFGNNTSSGMDIQKDPCGNANSPSNTWFVSICKTNIPNGVWKTDAFSLKFDAALTTGNTYKLSYLEYCYFSQGTYENIPIEIGLSLDSLSFGQTIYTSLPVIGTWTSRTFTFTAPNNGRYLTVKNVMTGTLPGWNYLDNFKIVSPSDIQDLSNSKTCTVYPNPLSERLYIEWKNDEQSEVFLYDIMSRKLLQQEFVNSVSLNTEALSKGFYFYEVRAKNGGIRKGTVVKE